MTKRSERQSQGTKARLGKALSRARRGSLAKFLARSPLAGAGLKLERRPEYGRPLDL
jgi:hypothetical protein